MAQAENLASLLQMQWGDIAFSVVDGKVKVVKATQAIQAKQVDVLREEEQVIAMEIARLREERIIRLPPEKSSISGWSGAP